MEQSGESPNNKSPDSARNEPIRVHHTKRIKERENAALQTTLTSARMEWEGATVDCGTGTGGGQEPGESEHSNGLSSDETAALPQPSTDPSAEVESDTEDVDENKARVEEEERTLTDHLNKRLLSSFLEKLNQKDLALPGVQRLDCAIANEDSNRAAEEW